MRIMLCPSAYAPHIGGVEELTYRLADEYQRQGHSVIIVTARWPKELPALETLNGIEVWRLDYVMPNRSLNGMLRFIALFPLRLFSLGLLIRQFRPDVVHIQCVSVQGFYLLLLKWMLRFRLVVTLQGERRADAHQVYQRSRIMIPMLTRLLHRADFVTACSKATLDDINDLWPTGSNRAVVPNGISLEEFIIVPKEELKPVAVRPYLFAIGRHDPVKGFDLLIEAFNRIAAQYPEIDLVIGGNGMSHQALQQLINNYGLNEQVHLPGYLNREQTVNYFRNCLFFVQPSRYESFGIASIEAMLTGKAVVATAVGGVSEIVKSGETGLLVPPENPEALAEGITQLLEKPEWADALGRAGRTLIEKDFGWPKIAARYLQIYNIQNANLT